MQTCDRRPAYLRVYFDGRWQKVVFTDPAHSIEYAYDCSHSVWAAARVLFELSSAGHTTTGTLRLQDFRCVFVDEDIMPEPEIVSIEPARQLLSDLFKNYRS